MKKGIFISIEGPDGAGKSTQIDLLKEYIETRGYEVLITREPGGTPISEKIREIILDKQNKEMTSMTEMLLYAASRAQHVAQVIRPALEEGKTVICDRFIDSSIAYQGYGRGLGSAVLDVNKLAIEGCMPDLTILMQIDPNKSTKRISVEARDRIEQENQDFHKRVYDGYLKLQKDYPNRVVGIDASRTIEEISRDIRTCVDKILEK